VSLPDYKDAEAQAADRPAFSNGTEGYAWMANWCDRCVHEADPDTNGGCPLLLVSMLGKTPAQWTEVDRRSLGSQYTCSEFEAVP
jgi:hypothetical protein